MKTYVTEVPCLMRNCPQKKKWKNTKIDPITQVLDVIMDKKYATEEEIEVIDKE
jgi:TPP-dependent pyruvate/acetoin dehydrogenase alpha subunit